MNDQQIEKEIVEKGKTAPRVTPEKIEGLICSEHFFTAAQGDHQAKEDDLIYNPEPYVEATPDALHLLTFCVLVLRNGFTAVSYTHLTLPTT